MSHLVYSTSWCLSLVYDDVYYPAWFITTLEQRKAAEAHTPKERRWLGRWQCRGRHAAAARLPGGAGGTPAASLGCSTELLGNQTWKMHDPKTDVGSMSYREKWCSFTSLALNDAQFWFCSYLLWVYRLLAVTTSLAEHGWSMQRHPLLPSLPRFVESQMAPWDDWWCHSHVGLHHHRGASGADDDDPVVLESRDCALDWKDLMCLAINIFLVSDWGLGVGQSGGAVIRLFWELYIMIYLLYIRFYNKILM